MKEIDYVYAYNGTGKRTNGLLMGVPHADPSGVDSGAVIVGYELSSDSSMWGSGTVQETIPVSGDDTFYYFEYGVSSQYGNKTQSEKAGAGTGIPVTADISGLLFDQTYHYRLVYINSSGPITVKIKRSW